MGIHFVRAVVWLPFGILDFLEEAFVLTLPYVCQIAAFFSCAGIFIQINGNSHFTHCFAYFIREGNTVLHGYTGYRGKRDDVNGAEKRLDSITKKHTDAIDEMLKNKEAELAEV